MANSTIKLSRVRLCADSVTAVSDLNDCVYSGVYVFTASTSNIPANYGVCVTVRNGDGTSESSAWIWQIAFGTSTNSIYIRRTINSESSWTSWSNIT